MTRSLGFWLAMMLGFAALGFAGCGGTAGSKSPADTDPKTPAGKICEFRGIRYIGSTDQRGPLCFTLTSDEKHLVEVGVYSTTSCDARDSSTLVLADYEGVLPEVRADGLVELNLSIQIGQRQIAELLFRGAVQGATASGIITNERCQSFRVKWTAHRLSKR
jgi:hypothetical protein